MKTILSQIQEFDSACLTVSEIFHAEKEISHEIYARTAFGDVSLADSQILTNMLQGITKNKLSAFENALVQPKKKDDQSIAEIFVQKIAIPAKNTAVSGLETPFYNMRVTMHKI
jgi:phage replication initiation protein